MNIVNPEKWVGKRVTWTGNWKDFQWPRGLDDKATDDYFVCEWTGQLTRICDEAYYGDVFETYEEAIEAGYDECYYYSFDGLMDMWAKVNG